jgi:XRE family transcriptional regulator, master regulator for biofilm formation
MIGKRISYLRMKKGYSISALAKSSGVSKSYLSQIERGIQGNPSLQFLSKLAATLDSSIEFLLGEDGSVPCKEQIDEEWASLFKEAINDGMSKQEFIELSKYIRFKNQQK